MEVVISPKKVRKVGEKSVLESPTRTTIYGGPSWGGNSRRPPEYSSRHGVQLEGTTRVLREDIPPRPRGGSANLVSFTSKFASIFTDITSKFADNLGLDCM